jgi:hypothetical protein
MPILERRFISAIVSDRRLLMKATSKQIAKKRRVARRLDHLDWLEQWRQNRRPVTIKINDTLSYHIEDEASIERLAHLVERLEGITAIRAGLKDVEQGRTISFEEFQDQARAKHGLSN